MNQMDSVVHPTFWSSILDDISHTKANFSPSANRSSMPAQQSSPNSKLPKALVTGATSGIGRAVALRLAQDGFSVIVHGRDAARGVQTVKEVTDNGGEASFVVADFNSPADIQRLAKEIGEIDVLVNNAGFAAWGPTAELDIATFDSMFASNVRAPFYLVGAFAPSMAARGNGSIINMSSMAGRLGLAGGAAYGATKAALISLTQAWAAEFSPRGVRVNAVAPGPVYTRPEARDLFDTLGATTPMKRAADPKEIAEVVAFLVSPRASYITGATIAVDGGRTAI
jgi:NAD(P)-dependent dehydrogenase (short-subunit alcohol dehydrogenase family)